MNQSRAELIDIVGRILCPDDWDDPMSIPRAIRSKHPLNLAEEIVTALRPEAKTRDCAHRQCPPDKCQGC